MSRNQLLEGIREIGRDPALLLIEIGWRWSFGAIALLIAGFSLFLVLDSISVDPRRLQALAALNPLQLAQTLADSFASASAVLWRVTLSVGLVLTAIWVLFSALGRYATLTRSALTPGASLQVCLIVSLLRAAVTLASIAAWFVAGLFAAMVGSATARTSMPNLGVMSIFLSLAFLVLVGVWSTFNWFLSLLPLRAEPTWTQAFLSTVTFIRLQRDQLLEISIVSGILRGGFFLIAVLLSVAAGSVITNGRVLFADLLAISLLYFLIADFLYLARFIAFGNLRSEPAAQSSSALLNSDSSRAITDRAMPMISNQQTPPAHDAG